MKKMIKMSLVAAVAVAGLTSNVAAKPLEDAIKNVDVSGMIRLRFDSETVGNAASSTATDFDTEITLKSKISDKSTAVIKVEADKAHTSTSHTTTTTDDGKSSRLNANISLAYLSTKVGSATVSVGRQGVPGPFDDAQGGDGVIALVPAGPVTIAAGFFTTTSVSAVEGKDAYELALIGKAGNVSYDLWHAYVANSVELTSIHAAAKVSGLSIDARHTMGTMDSSLSTAADKDASLTKIAVSGKASMVNYMAAVAVTGDYNGVSTNRIALDADGDAKSDLTMHTLSVGKLADATAFVVGANAKISDVTVGASYLTVDFGTNSDASELDLTAAYSLDTNLKLSAVYAASEVNSADTDETRIEVKYTF